MQSVLAPGTIFRGVGHGCTPKSETTMSKHERMLAAIFADPLSAKVKWWDVEALLVALGGEVLEGRGSRITVA